MQRPCDIALALNEAAEPLSAEPLSPELAVPALCVDLGARGKAPEWVELIPAGNVEGIDGRRWVNDQPDRLVAAFNARGIDAVIDYRHATDKPEEFGPEAPAAGWIDRLETRDGAVWGHVSWTERAKNAVGAREYRYLSPVFTFEKSTGRIVRFDRAALLNNPNLRLQALNVEGGDTAKEKPMEFLKKLIKALGLPEDTTEEAALNHVQKMSTDLEQAQNERDEKKADLEQARNEQANPPLDQYVPRATYDQVVQQAQNAEAKITEIRQAEHKQKVAAAIEKALNEGKITPATKDYYVAQCAGEDGLKKFEEFLESAPKIAEPSSLEGKQPEGEPATALNEEESRIAGMFGNSAEDLEKYAS